MVRSQESLCMRVANINRFSRYARRLTGATHCTLGFRLSKGWLPERAVRTHNVVPSACQRSA